MDDRLGSGSSAPRLAVALLAAALAPRVALAQAPPGYPEAIVQWGVQRGDTCEGIASSVYGNAKRIDLVLRYNDVACTRGAPLREGLTLVLPAAATDIPTARIDSLSPAVRARPAGGAWASAARGQPLEKNANVNTMETGRAGIRFIDRTRIVLSENTLVVIYGTAAQTSVQRRKPAAVEVVEGEAKAALAALRGDKVARVDVAGGHVEARSSDTVVQRKGTRATVSVFDGAARVESAGRAVDVPRAFGTRFQEKQPPSPPRPLPPAPAFTSPAPSLVLAGPDGASWTASWAPVAKATRYRVELATDPSFDDVVVREEVAAAVTSFRAEKFPPGAYHLRVRAIDDEDFLGMASDARALRVLAVAGAPAPVLEDGAIVVPACAELQFLDPAGVEVAIGAGEFSPLPSRVETGLAKAGDLRLRTRPGEEVPFRLETRLPPISLAATRQEGGYRVGVALEPSSPALVRCLALRARAVGGGRAEEVALVANPDGSLAGLLPWPDGASAERIEIVDALGRLVATEELRPPEPEPPPSKEGARRPPMGAVVPPFSASPRTDLWWTAPLARPALAAGGGVAVEGADAHAVGRLLAQGAWGPVSLDASIRTPFEERFGDGREGELAWLGGRFGTYAGDGGFAMGTYLRFGIPVLDDARLRADLGLAFGDATPAWSWLVNVGARPRFGSYVATSADVVDPYVLGGPTWTPTEGLRLFVVGGFQAIFAEGRDDLGAIDVVTLDPAPQLSFGAEAQLGPLLLGPHVTYAHAASGTLTAQLWLGYAPDLD